MLDPLLAAPGAMTILTTTAQPQEIIGGSYNRQGLLIAAASLSGGFYISVNPNMTSGQGFNLDALNVLYLDWGRWGDIVKKPWYCYPANIGDSIAILEVLQG